jgi:hypothetical protein
MKIVVFDTLVLTKFCSFLHSNIHVESQAVSIHVKR